MRLVSEHIVEGRQGPSFPRAYPTLEDVNLADIYAFTLYEMGYRQLPTIQ